MHLTLARWAARLTSMALVLAASHPADVAVAAPPKALSAKDQARIEALVQKAREQREARQYDEAIASLLEAIAIHPAPWLMYSLARVYEDAAKLELARRYYELALTDPDPETRQRAKTGLERVARLAEMGGLVLTLTPPDARVTVDGEPFTPDPAGRMALVPGERRLVVAHDGHVTEDQRVMILRGQTKTLAVTLRAEDSGGGTDFGIWPWVTMGAGAVVGVVGVILFVDGQSDWDEGVAERDQGLIDSGTPKVNAGAVLMGTGGLIVAGGLVMLLLDEDPSPSEAASPRVVPALALDADHLGFTLSGSF